MHVLMNAKIYLWCAAVVWGLQKWCAARGVLLVVWGLNCGVLPVVCCMCDLLQRYVLRIEMRLSICI